MICPAEPERFRMATSCSSTVAVTTLGTHPLVSPFVLLRLPSRLFFTPLLGLACRPLSCCFYRLALSNCCSRHCSRHQHIYRQLLTSPTPISSALTFVFYTLTTVSTLSDLSCILRLFTGLVLSLFRFPFNHSAAKMSQAQGDIQERIAAARREAESLKEKIRAKKESSADTSRASLVSCNTRYRY